MGRAPLQAIVIPFRRDSQGRLEYAVFHRTDNSMWHFVSGGAEDSETAFEAAVREAAEESGIPRQSRWLALDSKASVPRTAFPETAHWPSGLFVVPEYSFAVEVGDHRIVLSPEHDEVRWLPFEEATVMLTWDSNKVALWELNERLRTRQERKVEV